MKPKLLRITTVPLSMHKLLQGQVNYMQENRFDVVLACADGKEIATIEQETGLGVNILPLTRKIALFQDLKALWYTYKLLKKEKPEIIHTHTPKAGLLGMIAAKIAGVPIRMHTVAGLPLMQATGLKRKLLNFTERLTSWAATNVYPNSFAMAKFIIAQGLAPKDKTKVLANGSSNGINTQLFDPKCYQKAAKDQLRKQLSIADNELVFTFIGRLVRDKGINELIKAFKSLASTTLSDRFDSVTERSRSHRSIKLLLVGDQEATLDPLASETVKTIEESPNIITTGWVEDVRPYLAISDVFVFPSYREGMPNVILQAGAMGLPQIVTDINGSNEIIVEEENGIIIPIKDTTALFDAMQQMLNPTLRKELSKHAHELISKRFEQKMVWDALLREYEALMGNKG